MKYHYHAACTVLLFLLVEFWSLVLIHHYYKVGGTAKRITICQGNCQWEFHWVFFCVIICHAQELIIWQKLVYFQTISIILPFLYFTWQKSKFPMNKNLKNMGAEWFTWMRLFSSLLCTSLPKWTIKEP